MVTIDKYAVKKNSMYQTTHNAFFKVIFVFIMYSPSSLIQQSNKYYNKVKQPSEKMTIGKEVCA